jgi:hypothetical protein
MFSYIEEYRLVHWCTTYNMSRAAINKLFRNPMTETINNFALGHTVVHRLNEISDTKGIDEW